MVGTKKPASDTSAEDISKEFTTMNLFERNKNIGGLAKKMIQVDIVFASQAFLLVEQSHFHGLCLVVFKNI